MLKLIKINTNIYIMYGRTYNRSRSPRCKISCL